MLGGACLVFLVALAQAATPQPAATPPPPVFAAGTDLVTVDVTVVDASGNPVEGLTQADFQVLEDGQVRQIVSFEAVHTKVPPPVDPAAPPPPRPLISTNAPVPAARTFVIVMDELHLGSAAALRARKTIASFLKDGTRPGDRVQVVATGGGRGWAGSMPEAREDLLAVLERMGPKARPTIGNDHITDWEALRIYVHRDERVASTVLRRFFDNGVIPDCVPAPGESGCGEVYKTLESSPLVTMRASEVYQDSARRRRSTLETLASVMESLMGQKGRKAVLLVSEGFVHEPTQSELHVVYDAARRANAAINFVDARGLAIVDTQILEDSETPTQETASASGKPSSDLGLALAQPHLLAEGSDAVAAQTGGQSFKNSNDLRRGFDQLAREWGTYYLVGYAPVDSARDGRFRKIEVRVARPRVEVRARRGYVVPRESDLRARREGEQGLPTPPPPLLASSLPMRMAAYTLDETGKGKVRVVLAGEVDPSQLQWKEVGDRFEDTVDTTLTLLGRKAGEPIHDSRLVELSLPAPTRALLDHTWLPVLREFELDPGVYQASLGVRDSNSGRAGAVHHVFEVPAAGAFRISTPILSDAAQSPTDAAQARISPIARRAFPRGTRLLGHFEVLNPGRNAAGTTQLRAGHVLRRAGGAVISRMEPGPMAAGADGRLTRTLAISLRTAAPGAHELVLTVHDDVTGKMVETTEAFEVTNAEVAQFPAAAAALARPAARSGLALVDPRATLDFAERQVKAGGPLAQRWSLTAALMLDALGRGNDAMGRLQSLAKQEPPDPDVLLALGALEEYRVESVAARAVEAAPIGSESLPTFQRRGARDRALRQAEARFRIVLAYRPTDTEARLRLGRVLQRRQDAEALRHLQQVAREADGDMKSLAHLFLGEWHEAEGQLPQAVLAYRQAVGAAPQAQTASIALSQALLRHGDAAAARATVESGLVGAAGLDPFLAYTRPALRLGSSLVAGLEREGAR